MSDRQEFACHSVPLCGVCAGHGRKGRAAPMERPTVYAAKHDLRSQAGKLDKTGRGCARTEGAQNG